MSKILIQLTAIIFLFYGLSCLFFPVEVLRFVVEGSVSSPSGVIDIRATYGGMSLGIAVILFILARKRSTIKLGLISVLAIMSGMAIGRSTGIYLDGSANRMMYVYLTIEVVVVLLSLALLKKQR